MWWDGQQIEEPVPERRTIYVSHSAGNTDGSVNWFVVEPQHSSQRITTEQAVSRLLRTGRRVYVIKGATEGPFLRRVRHLSPLSSTKWWLSFFSGVICGAGLTIFLESVIR